MITTYCGVTTFHTLSKEKQKPKSAESGPQIRLEHPLSDHTVTPFTLARY